MIIRKSNLYTCAIVFFVALAFGILSKEPWQIVGLKTLLGTSHIFLWNLISDNVERDKRLPYLIHLFTAFIVFLLMINMIEKWMK